MHLLKLHLHCPLCYNLDRPYPRGFSSFPFCRNFSDATLPTHRPPYCPVNTYFTSRYTFKYLSLLNYDEMERGEIKEEVPNKDGEDLSLKKNFFVARATGSTGKRIVEQLLAKGFSVKAGVRDLDKANATFSQSNNPALQFVSIYHFQ